MCTCAAGGPGLAHAFRTACVCKQLRKWHLYVHQNVRTIWAQARALRRGMQACSWLACRGGGAPTGLPGNASCPRCACVHALSVSTSRCALGSPTYQAHCPRTQRATIGAVGVHPGLPAQGASGLRQLKPKHVPHPATPPRPCNRCMCARRSVCHPSRSGPALCSCLRTRSCPSRRASQQVGSPGKWPLISSRVLGQCQEGRLRAHSIWDGLRTFA